MPAGIAAGESAPAILFIRQRDDDRRAGPYGTFVHGVGVVHGEVDGLGLAPADFVGLG